MNLFKRHKCKRLDIGKLPRCCCVRCGRKMHCYRSSKYDFETGDEVSAVYNYECTRCGIVWS